MLSEITRVGNASANATMKQTHVRLLAQIVPLLLPRITTMHPNQRTRIQQEVVGDVVAQMSAMPHFLRIAYQIILYVFNYLAILRYGRIYTALDQTRQQNYLRLWSNSPIGSMRDFMKLIRSCALLHYLDHPAVLAQLERYRHEPEERSYHH